MLNLMSLMLGLIGWIIPIVMLAPPLVKRCGWFPIPSFTACAAALVVQFFEIERRVNHSDWSALMDIVPSLAKVAAALLVITLILNVLVWAVRGMLERERA